MKILVITRSPRKNGNSDTLADNFIKGATEKGHSVIKFESAFKKVHPCMADVENAFAAVRPSAMVLIHTPHDRAENLAGQLSLRCGIRVLAPNVGDSMEL